jgi:hypothetical protein
VFRARATAYRGLHAAMLFVLVASEPVSGESPIARSAGVGYMTMVSGRGVG